MTIMRLSFAAALMCGAMALPAAAADTGADANSTAGITTTAPNSQANTAADARGSLDAPSPSAGVNGGINPAQDQGAQDQGAMNANGGVAANADAEPQAAQSAQENGQLNGQANEQAGAQAGASQNLAMNESTIRDVGGDTSQKYSVKRRSADNQKEADITAQLNQKASQMASSNSQADSR